MKSPARQTFSYVVFCLCLAPATAFSQAQSVVGIGPGMYFEDGALNGEEKVSVETRDESFDYKGDSILNFSIWYLWAASKNLRLGANVMYFGSYGAEIQPDEPLDDGEDPDTYEFGPLWEVYAKIEYLVPTYEGLDIMFGAVAGIPVLFPAGDLEQEIEGLQDQQASVWGGPRFGYLIGPVIAARYAYSEYLYFRLDLGLKWEQILIFNTSESVQDVAFSKDWVISTLRTEFVLGIEVAL